MEKLQRLARSLRKARAAELPSDPKDAINVLVPMIMQNQYSVVDELLASSTLDISQKFGKANRTLLHIASNIGAYECLVLLLKKGADVNCQDRSGLTPLQLSARNGHGKCIQKLFEYKANVEVRNNEGMTAVHWLASNGRTELLSELLPDIKNIDIEDLNGQTALHVACLNGHMTTVAKLLDGKANIEKKDFKGCTPLYFASSHGHSKLVRELLRRGAVMRTTRTDMSPLNISFKNGYGEVCGVIVEHDPSLLNLLLELCQKDHLEEDKVNKILKHICTLGPTFHKSVLNGLADLARTCGFELLSVSSDYQTTVWTFIRTVNILFTLVSMKPSQLQALVRTESTSNIRSRRLDSTSSRILKSLGGSGSGSPPLLDPLDDSTPLNEVTGPLADLWNAMENWFELISKDMQQIPDSTNSASMNSHLDAEGTKGHMGAGDDRLLPKLDARQIAKALLKKKPKSMKRRSLVSLDSLRLSQPALEFNLGIYNSNLTAIDSDKPASEYKRSVSAGLNIASDMHTTDDVPSSPDRRLRGSAPPMYTMTLNRNLASIHGNALQKRNNTSGNRQTEDDDRSRTIATSATNDCRGAPLVSERSEDNAGTSRLERPLSSVGSETLGAASPLLVSDPERERCFSPTDHVVEATADRLCALVHGYYISCASKLYWEESDNRQAFDEFIERHSEVLELLVARKPTVIFEHFHFLLENPLLLTRFLTVIHAQKFSDRREWFYENLHRGKESMNPQEFDRSTITVLRDTLLQSSCEQILHKDAAKLKQGVNIQFSDEAGLGEGVLREWLDLLLKELLNPDFALFTLSADGATFQPNSNSFVNPDHLNYFRFAGQIMGLALYHKQLVNAYFTRSFYKHILGVPVNYSDVASIDPEYAKNLQWILDHEINNLGLDLTFSVESDDFGQFREVNLKPNGNTITVTDENKDEYVQLAADLRMTKAIKPQIYSFLEGFHQFVPHSLVVLFDEYELEIMLSGIPEIDSEDWRKNTSYASGYDEESQIIKWFWEIVETFEKKQRVKLLQFITGSSRVPWGGFSNLSGGGGRQNFTISAGGEESQLPTASTCFNLLKLPDYKTKEQLEKKLLVALDCGHLGFEYA